jgi:hypothetical protein
LERFAILPPLVRSAAALTPILGSRAIEDQWTASRVDENVPRREKKMRIMWSLAAALTITVSGPAWAETWKARAELIETKSAEGCPRQLSVYTLDLAGDTFSATDVDGKMFSISLPANGVIKEDYRSPTGNRLEMSGNVRTKHLEIYSGHRGCWWRLVAEK